MNPNLAKISISKNKISLNDEADTKTVAATFVGDFSPETLPKSVRAKNPRALGWRPLQMSNEWIRFTGMNLSISGKKSGDTEKELIGKMLNDILVNKEFHKLNKIVLTTDYINGTLHILKLSNDSWGNLGRQKK